MTDFLAYQLSERINFLSQTVLFQDLPQRQLADLAQLSISLFHAKNDILFRQGDDAIGFFIVKSGRVKVFKLSAEGKEQILHVFGCGDHFAEVPALDGHCFPASASTLETSEVLFFPRLAFLQLLETQPQLAINLLKSFARHLRHFSQLVDHLTLRDIPARLASYLLNLSESTELMTRVELDLPKGQLAARLGTIPETLSRVLAKLSHDGLIEVEGAKITLVDPQKLKQLVIG